MAENQLQKLTEWLKCFWLKFYAHNFFLFFFLTFIIKWLYVQCFRIRILWIHELFLFYLTLRCVECGAATMLCSSVVSISTISSSLDTCSTVTLVNESRFISKREELFPSDRRWLYRLLRFFLDKLISTNFVWEKCLMFDIFFCFVLIRTEINIQNLTDTAIHNFLCLKQDDFYFLSRSLVESKKKWIQSLIDFIEIYFSIIFFSSLAWSVKQKNIMAASKAGRCTQWEKWMIRNHFVFKT